jgi:hypothetical protein
MLELELGPDMERQLAQQARTRGLSIDAYVREKLVLPHPRSTDQPVFTSTLEEPLQAAKELSTFAMDRGINVKLSEDTNIRDYIREATGF